ncbi:hypothetical protein [Streptomyces sp. SS8]
MSEYQHYQFLADQPLTDSQSERVRALTTRARLTRTTFLNTYEWGDFKGDPKRLMERYYDAFLYFANWGTRHVMLRWPARALPLRVAERYCVAPAATAWQHGGHVIVSLASDPQDDSEDFNDLFTDGDYDYGEEREEQWLPSIARARTDVAAGDLRLLYLAWLLAVQDGAVPQHATEPPLPAGLAGLPASLEDLAVFLRIDPDLIAAAARPLPTLSPAPAARTAAQLLQAVPAQAALRAERRARREAEAEIRAHRAATRAREQRLTELQGREDSAWHRIDDLLTVASSSRYRQATLLLTDLAILAERDGTAEKFKNRCRNLRHQHSRKKTFLRRLDEAGL